MTSLCPGSEETVSETRKDDRDTQVLEGVGLLLVTIVGHGPGTSEGRDLHQTYGL